MSSSYTFFKLLDLSRSNSQKNTFINVNILISISLITPYLLHSIPISKPKKTPPKKNKYTYFFPHQFSTKKKKNLPLHASLSLYLFLLHCSSPSTARLPAKKKSHQLHNWLVSHFFFRCYNFLDRIILLYSTLVVLQTFWWLLWFFLYAIVVFQFFLYE